MLDELLDRYLQDITCVAFMGGDAEPEEINRLAAYLQDKYPQVKTAWYSGRLRLHRAVELKNLNFVKIGPYIAHLGPLNKETTNQRLYRVSNGEDLQDITYKFWKKR